MRRTALGAFLALAVALALLWNAVVPLGAMMAPGGDYGHWVWTLWVVNESLKSGHSPYHTSLIYFPHGAHLAQHTLVPGLWPLTFLVDLVTGSDALYPVYTHRLASLLGTALALGLCWLALRRAGFARALCALPALQYTFSVFSRGHLPHLHQVGALWLTPAVALAILALGRTPGRRTAAVLALLLGGGVYFSEMVVFLWMGVAVFAAAAFALPSTRERARDCLRQVGPRGALVASLVFLLVLVPFVMAWGDTAGKPPKHQLVLYSSADVASLVVPPPDSAPLYGWLEGRLYQRLRKRLGAGFLGLPLVVFAAVGLLARRRNEETAHDRARRGWLGAAAITGAFFLVLSLGPELRLAGLNTGLPLPYALLREVPPFDMGRAPVRCVVPALMCLAFAAAAGLARLRRQVASRWGGSMAAAAVAVATAWAVAEAWEPMAAGRRYPPPAALANLRPGAVVNVPLSVTDGFAALLQVFHQRPMATGYISRRTPQQVEYVRGLDRMLEADTGAFLRELERQGFGNVIVGPGTPPWVARALGDGPLTMVDLREAW